jgi:hypothetical protein
MTGRLGLAMVMAVLAGCGPAATATPLTVHSGDAGPISLAAGTYRFAWTTGCTTFFLEWAPTSGAAPIEIPIADPRAGEAIVTIPAGPAYLNRGGSCAGDYTVTVSRAP